VISVCWAPSTDSALQLARTEMSPAMHSEHSYKQRQGRSAKEWCGNVLTRNFSATGTELRQRLAIGQNRNATCELFGTFAGASSADGSPQTKDAGNILPDISVFSALKTDSSSQLAKTEMSPAEHSRKHRQRTGPQKK